MSTLRARPDRLIVLAQLLMTARNAQASQDPGVERCLNTIAERWGVEKDDLLRWSFFPREMLVALRIRKGLTVAKKQEGRAVRSLRQLQVRQPGTYGDVPLLKGRKLSEHERQWWASNFGLDKESGVVSRQRIWGEIELGLCRLLEPSVMNAHTQWLKAGGELPEEASWRAAARAVSRLLQVRYPDLWPDRPDRIRSRFLYEDLRQSKQAP
jgi:hypothetical protein